MELYEITKGYHRYNFRSSSASSSPYIKRASYERNYTSKSYGTVSSTIYGNHRSYDASSTSINVNNNRSYTDKNNNTSSYDFKYNLRRSSSSSYLSSSSSSGNNLSTTTPTTPSYLLSPYSAPRWRSRRLLGSSTSSSSSSSHSTVPMI